MTKDLKTSLRTEARTRRACAASVRGEVAATLAARRFVDGAQPRAGQVVALYCPVRDELNTAPLIEMLDLRHVVLALPVVDARGAPLVFRRWKPGQPLEDGAFGIKVPPAHADIVRPDVLAVPLLAFDDGGHRLGYGGGFYDRTLRALRGDGGPCPLAVGLAFAEQRVPRLPTHAGDQVLDMVVTDKAIHRFQVEC
ncbi:MAG: 5-formyltetrahydrofolate cyclo-ligase [Sphingomonadales bacterium]